MWISGFAVGGGGAWLMVVDSGFVIGGGRVGFRCSWVWENMEEDEEQKRKGMQVK